MNAVLIRCRSRVVDSLQQQRTFRQSAGDFVKVIAIGGDQYRVGFRNVGFEIPKFSLISARDRIGGRYAVGLQLTQQDF